MKSKSSQVTSRLQKYKRNAEILRQIHSDKKFRKQRTGSIHLVVTLVLSTLVAFLGFIDVNRMTEFMNWFVSIDAAKADSIFDLLVFLVLVAILLELIFRFREAAAIHHRSILILTNFIREVDDLLGVPDSLGSDPLQTLKEIRERYDLIGELLPPSTDREFLRSKRRLAKKKRESHFVDERPLTLTPTSSEEETKQFMSKDGTLSPLLDIVSGIDDAECWMSSGVIRNRVWDALHGYRLPTPIDDVDVVFFEPDAPDLARSVQAALSRAYPNQRWSVTNQAEIHERTGDSPYGSLEDAISKWPETATAVAIRREPKGALRVIAPHGFGDLLTLIVRPTQHFERYPDRYEARVQTKAWKDTWPRLQIIHPKKPRDKPLD